MRNTVFVTGATGLLGRQVVKAFERNNWDVTGCGFSRALSPIIKLDLTNEKEIAKAITLIKPCVVVHCAANRFPEKCNNDKEGTYAINITSSFDLASICAANNILLIYISTDYVFSGKLGEAPYETDSKPEPSNFYGETKLKGEQVVQRAYESAGKHGFCVVLRVPVLYGSALTLKESAVNTLLDTLIQAQDSNIQVQMDDWSIRYPTNTEDVARVCYDVARKYLSTSDKRTLPTVLQFTSEDRYTKYEICKIFAGISKLPLDNVKPKFTEDDSNDGVQRPYDCHLSTKKLKDLGIDVHTVNFTDWWRRETRDGLREMINKFPTS
ncbi:Methionine adenosyltransferase 2 subunit beta [Golovinomyces cichoracearum]|uniref:Methionine adenosyltransferase 2 subunit beta n=1 Tax=Golovinomyces cichoracearum TaxID=62708 RepID=A0A420I7Q6_9PEZI|nr:Methionine adenosyltransferase 2 subunit beta [Golovinomyces cichoracearum]